MPRVHDNEFALIREYYMRQGNNYTLIVNLLRRDFNQQDNRNIPEAILRLWREASQEQLRRRIRDAIGRRIGQ